MMIPLLLFLNYLVMIGLPVVLALWIRRRWGVGWRLFFMGAVTFIGAQLLHIPFNWLVLQRLELLPTDVTVTANLIVLALFLGLSAGVFEEVARYLTYRYWARAAHSWRGGMMLGAGHGGIEAIIFGVSGLLTFVLLLAVREGALDIAAVAPGGQAEAVQAQIAAMFGLPWYMTVLGAVERLFALTLHLSLSLLVLQAFLRQNRLWLLAAILWHALANAVAVLTLETWGALAAEAALSVIALGSAGIIYRLYLWDRERVAAEAPGVGAPEAEPT